MKTRLMVVGAAVGMLLGAACADTEKTASGALSLRVVSPSSGSVVKGNVVDLALEVHGISIVAADGNTTGKTGHFHVFVDRDPVAAAAVIPKEAGIVHTTSNPVRIAGLPAGTHVFTVVIGDGAHKRIGQTQATTSVRVEGPTLNASAPATAKAGEPVTVTMNVGGVALVKADGKQSATAGHLHLFVDREPTAPGVAIPKETGIIHSTSTSVAVPGLAAGEHVIWVVLGDGLHVPFDPPVMDKVTVTVS